MGFLQTSITATHTASFTPTPAATIYLIDATAGNLTVTLPVAGAAPNSVYEFRRIDAAGHTVTLAGATDSTISPAVADTVNGAGSVTLAAGTALCLVSDGAAGWYDLSSNSGGGGALTPTSVTIGTPGDTLGKLTVAGDVADVISAAVFGSDAPTYGQAAVEAHTGSGFALFGQASGANGTAVYGVATGTGSYGGTFQNDSGTGLSSQVTTGEAAYFLASNPAGLALHLSGAMLQGDGPLILLPLTEPATPPSSGAALYLDSADGKVKIKDSGGTVHALW